MRAQFLGVLLNSVDGCRFVWDVGDGSGRRMSIAVPMSGTSGRGVERVGHGRKGSGAARGRQSGTQRPVVPASETFIDALNGFLRFPKGSVFDMVHL